MPDKKTMQAVDLLSVGNLLTPENNSRTTFLILRSRVRIASGAFKFQVVSPPFLIRHRVEGQQKVNTPATNASLRCVAREIVPMPSIDVGKTAQDWQSCALKKLLCFLWLEMASQQIVNTAHGR